MGLNRMSTWVAIQSIDLSTVQSPAFTLAIDFDLQFIVNAFSKKHVGEVIFHY